MAKAVLLTSEGLKNLQDELENLKTVVRNEIAEKIKIARGFGDLSENSEYDEAKDEQAKTEARISEIEEMLKNVEIIDEANIRADIVNLGSTGKVLDCEFDEEITYKIVGTNEANPLLGKISDQSPIGSAMLGKGVGEEILVSSPSGELKFKILSVERSKPNHA